MNFYSFWKIIFWKFATLCNTLGSLINKTGLKNTHRDRKVIASCEKRLPLAVQLYEKKKGTNHTMITIRRVQNWRGRHSFGSIKHKHQARWFTFHKSSSSISVYSFLVVVLGIANFWLPFDDGFVWLTGVVVDLTVCKNTIYKSYILL